VVKREASPLPPAKTQPARRGRPVHDQGHRTRQDQHIGAPGGVQATVDGVEQRVDETVLRAGDILEVQLDLSFDTGRLPQQEMGRLPAQLVPPIALAHSQGVEHRHRARRRAVGGLQHHGALHIAASYLAGTRPDRPVPGPIT
jgi:hypothetical protein